jgi:predicted site-specific integrase-resolvase
MAPKIVASLEDLATDVLEIITVFSARLYASRSHKNKKIVDELKEIVKSYDHSNLLQRFTHPN